MSKKKQAKKKGKGKGKKSAKAKPAPKAAKAPAKTLTSKKLGGELTKALDEARKRVAEAGKKKMSGLDAAAKVLAEAKGPLSTKEMVERMLAKGYWQTKGKTPAATLYSAIFREIGTKGKDARFKKAGPGKFTLKK